MTKPLADALRDVAPKKGPIGPWLRAIAEDTHQRNLRRAERVRRYDDLVEALADEGIDARTWNGYIPPEFWPVSPSGDMLHDRQGHPNAKRRRTRPGEPGDPGPRNLTPDYVALTAVVSLANQRDREAGLDVDDPSADEIVARHPFPIPGLKRGPFYDVRPEPPPAENETRQQRRQRERHPDRYDADRQHSPMRGPGRQ